MSLSHVPGPDQSWCWVPQEVPDRDGRGPTSWFLSFVRDPTSQESRTDPSRLPVRSPCVGGRHLSDGGGGPVPDSPSLFRSSSRRTVPESVRVPCWTLGFVFPTGVLLTPPRPQSRPVPVPDARPTRTATVIVLLPRLVCRRTRLFVPRVPLPTDTDTDRCWRSEPEGTGLRQDSKSQVPCRILVGGGFNLRTVSVSSYVSLPSTTLGRHPSVQTVRLPGTSTTRLRSHTGCARESVRPGFRRPSSDQSWVLVTTLVTRDSWERPPGSVRFWGVVVYSS